MINDPEYGQKRKIKIKIQLCPSFNAMISALFALPTHIRVENANRSSPLLYDGREFDLFLKLAFVPQFLSYRLVASFVCVHWEILNFISAWPCSAESFLLDLVS